MPTSSISTVKLQDIVDIAQAFGDIAPVLNVPQSASQPALTIANDVMNAICALPFPHKWNEMLVPQFYTNSFQQDYAGINTDGTSVLNLSWLERGICIDINNTAIPKPWRLVECGRQLPQQTGSVFNSGTSSPLFLVNWFPNNMLYYGTWGAGNVGSSSFGSNPGVGSVYQSLISTTGLTSMPFNPIAQIKDVNGNLLVLTTAGTEGTAAPVLPPNSLAGQTVSGTGPVLTLTKVAVVGTAATYTGTITGGANNAFVGVTFVVSGFAIAGNNVTFVVTSSTATTLVGVTSTQANETHAGVAGPRATTQWTVADPFGTGFRILPVPSQTGIVWQFNLVAQMRPVRFKTLSQNLSPLPDEFEPNFRQGFIAQCYRYSPEAKIRAKFGEEWQLWLKAMYDLRAKEDFEMEENSFVPDRGIMGGTAGRQQWYGPQWPFQYPTR